MKLYMVYVYFYGMSFCQDFHKSYLVLASNEDEAKKLVLESPEIPSQASYAITQICTDQFSEPRVLYVHDELEN